MESGQNLCTGRFWAVFFFVFGVSEQLESSIGCRIRLRALMNLGGGPTEGPPSPAAALRAARGSDAPRPQPPRRSTRNAATQTLRSDTRRRGEHSVHGAREAGPAGLAGIHMSKDQLAVPPGFHFGWFGRLWTRWSL